MDVPMCSCCVLGMLGIHREPLKRCSVPLALHLMALQSGLLPQYLSPISVENKQGSLRASPDCLVLGPPAARLIVEIHLNTCSVPFVPSTIALLSGHQPDCLWHTVIENKQGSLCASPDCLVFGPPVDMPMP